MYVYIYIYIYTYVDCCFRVLVSLALARLTSSEAWQERTTHLYAAALGDIHIYIYIYTHTYVSISLSLSIYIYIWIIHSRLVDLRRELGDARVELVGLRLHLRLLSCWFSVLYVFYVYGSFISILSLSLVTDHLLLFLFDLACVLLICSSQ